MSRYRFAAEGYADVIVGWDDSAGFFAQLWRNGEASDDEPAHWIPGVKPIEQLELELRKRNVSLPESLTRQLGADSTGSPISLSTGDACVWRFGVAGLRLRGIVLAVVADDELKLRLEGGSEVNAHPTCVQFVPTDFE